MDTLGNVVDKLFTVNMKTWYAKENNDKPKHENLRSQRKSLTIEIDEISENIFKGKLTKEEACRPQHKTY